MESNKIDISSSIILRILGIILIGGFLYLIREVIAILLVAVVVSIALNPIIKKIQNFSVSRTLAVVFVYLIFFLFVGGLVSFVVPLLINQFQEFFKSFPELLSKVIPQNFHFSDEFSSFDFQNYLLDSVPDIFSKTMNFVTGFISALAVISLSFYISLQENGLKNFIILLTPINHREHISRLIDEIYNSFGRWMMGLLVTMFFVGALYYLALSTLGIKFAVVLALIGGFLEIIPYFGPILAGVPAIILGFLQSPLIGCLVLVAYWLINLIENHILIPKIMNKAVGLNPVFIIVALLIGGKLAGILGLFLAVPLAGVVNVLVKDFLENRKK